MERYNHREIEQKWQKKWQKNGLYTVEDVVEGKENYYQLVEFPYPSGNLHVGHWYAFAVPDIHARFQRMQGNNVLYPIGFDAFGLPAENAAIKNNVSPAEWTESNMEHMRGQIRSMGASFDWAREVVTCHADYYRWTQWLFVQLFKAGLVERRTTEANWCPSCKTVLANEQVVADTCERCDTPVGKKEMPQWRVRITDYADRLIDDLETVDWPQEIKTAQKNWIGRSEGAEITFDVKNSTKKIKVFTTRPDTLYGVTYMVLAPEHALIEELKEHISNFDDVQKYVLEAKKKTEIERTAEGKEKTGVRLDGVIAINPANGKEIPVYIADYVLAQYGTGAIMAVPAHDQRDFDFAQKYGIEIIPVIASANNWRDYDGKKIYFSEEVYGLDNRQYFLFHEEVFKGGGVLANSGEFDGMKSEEAGKKIVEKVGGKMTTTYKLRDWGVSRQRYWGCPIPLVHCENCDWQAVPDDQLPVELPEVEDYLPNDNGQSPLSKNEEFVCTTCPTCGAPATRETDTLDTFVDSSWYFLRYCDAHNEKVFAGSEKMKKWMPVDLYSGGAEHTTMHLLYSRFFHKALYDLKLVGDKEPYVKRMNRGLIMGPDGNKMSKSKGNVIDPDDIVQKLGADTMRLYLAFIGPYNEVGSYPWNPESIIGVRRFVERVWKLQAKVTTQKADRDIDRALHKALSQVTDSIADYKLNTGVAALMTCVNTLEKSQTLSQEQRELFLCMLAPYAPHITEHLWADMGHKTSIHLEPWPEVDEALLVEDTFELVVQVNGKVRDKIIVASESSDKKLEEIAQTSEKVQKYTKGKTMRKVIVIQGKLVNIVVS